MRLFPSRAKTPEVGITDAPALPSLALRRTEITVERECITEFRRTYTTAPAETAGSGKPALEPKPPDG